MHSATQPETDKSPSHAPRSILVIDDDRSFRELLRTLLMRAGYDVHEAANGLDGLRIVARTTLHLMITDIIMPEQEGMATIRSARNHSPQLKILAITGAAACQGYLALAMRLGADAALEKALVPKLLLTTIGSLIQSP